MVDPVVDVARASAGGDWGNDGLRAHGRDPAMDLSIVELLDFSDRDEPTPTSGWRQLLTAWLDDQRHQFMRKLRDVSREGLVAWPVPPLDLAPTLPFVASSRSRRSTAQPSSSLAETGWSATRFQRAHCADRCAARSERSAGAVPLPHCEDGVGAGRGWERRGGGKGEGPGGADVVEGW
jgi:hypothetical protein